MGQVSGTRWVHGCELLEYRYGPDLLPGRDDGGPAGMWRYRALLPVDPGPIHYPVPVGGTPLLALPGLRAVTGVPELFVKDETRGPSASNKDRATALVLEGGLRTGADTITTASTGNAAVATALGAAAVALRSVIFVSTGCRPDKVGLMRAAGARVFALADGYSAAVELSRAAAREFGWLDRNTGVNPYTTEAKKTVALEIWEQLRRQPPDVVVAPVGDGPTLAGLAKGFDELLACGGIERLPRLIGVQAANCQPLVRAWAGADGPATSGAPGDPASGATTIADGIAVTRPTAGALALDAVRRTGGAMVAVPDDALSAAGASLLRYGGLGSEPAGAAGLAGLAAALAGGLVDRAERVVVMLTGRELAAGPTPVPEPAAPVIEPNLDAVRAALADHPRN
ncbi:threonine synthase [Plantactinospora sp. CA-294935]|uniref:threonine synthase n=1 Tax=Plantactinospora sp. CA-294935 TaxID=3240012 RepID=UPI003D8B2CF0